MLELGLKVLLSYLLGSINGSLVLGRLKGVDIRTSGSGNAGGTNALRTQGALFALLVIIIDVGKGYLAAALVPGLALAPGETAVAGPIAARLALMLPLACAAAAIVGHCYPVWFGFAGGKGAATAVGALAGIAPVLVLAFAAVWLLTLVVSGMVGLATILAAGALPLYAGIRDGVGNPYLLLFLGWLAIFILFTHRSNVRRIMAGEESRWAKAMLFRRRSG